MKQLKLGLVNDKDKRAYLLDKDYILIPLKGENNYHEQTPVKKNIVDVYDSMQPTIICIREQSCTSGETWWPHHWTDVLKALVRSESDNVMYVSDWIIDEETVNDFIPKGYDGRILKRGNRIQLLLEATEGLFQYDFMCGIWNYGTSGYIFSRAWENEFISYTTKEIIGLEDIKDFYMNMNYTFWMGGEIDIMYLLCHKNDNLRVEKILSEANSNYFFL